MQAGCNLARLLDSANFFPVVEAEAHMNAAGPPQGVNCAPAFGGSAAAEWANEAASVGVLP